MRGTNTATVEATAFTWVRAHEALTRLAQQRAAADAEEGRWLLAARRSAAHAHLGFGSFWEYIERLFGYTPRTTHEKLRVAEALEELPCLARALETGSLGWSAARELTRVAIADTEQQWLELAQGKTMRQLEELVAGRRPGDDPGATAQPSAARHVLRFEVAAETFALFREAYTTLRRHSDHALDDDSVLLAMARHVLGGPTDDGRASYQIALNVCPACGVGQQQAGGDSVTVSPDVVAMAQCDAQHLGPLPSLAANESHADVNARPDEGESTIQATPTRARHQEAPFHGPHLTNEEAVSHLAGNPEPQPHRTSAHVGTHAKQTIPPALRRTALRRDRQRCRVPGCRNATFLDLHHIELRSEDGRNELANLVTVCGAHHRAAHRGQLIIEPDSRVGIRVRHSDGTDYGYPLQPKALDVQAKLFSALRGLGFREREVRTVLGELRQDPTLRDASIEQLLREGLRRIRSSPVKG